MTRLLEKAIEQIAKLPESEQDAVAARNLQQGSRAVAPAALVDQHCPDRSRALQPVANAGSQLRQSVGARRADVVKLVDTQDLKSQASAI